MKVASDSRNEEIPRSPVRAEHGAPGTGKTYKAKVVAQDLETLVPGPLKYDVTFSTGISDDAKNILQRAICGSNSISNKLGLPFACKNP